MNHLTFESAYFINLQDIGFPLTKPFTTEKNKNSKAENHKSSNITKSFGKSIFYLK